MRKFPEPFTEQRRAGGLRLWLASGFDVPPRVEKILGELARPSDPGVEILKSSNRRSVLRVKNFSPEIRSVVVKGFPLKKIESSFKHKKYGLAEFHNYREAAARGIPMPKCYGCFEVRSFFLVKANGVLIEDLMGFRNLDELARETPAQKLKVLLTAIPLLKLLFETGVNHIDPSPHNMMQSSSGAELRLIDWQYCSFVAPRQSAQLALHAAHFLNFAACEINSDDWNHWLNELQSVCGCKSPREKFQRAVAALQSRGKISGDERLALALDSETLGLLEEN